MLRRRPPLQLPLRVRCDAASQRRRTRRCGGAWLAALLLLSAGHTRAGESIADGEQLAGEYMDLRFQLPGDGVAVPPAWLMSPVRDAVVSGEITLGVAVDRRGVAPVTVRLTDQEGHTLRTLELAAESYGPDLMPRYRLRVAHLDTRELPLDSPLTACLIEVAVGGMQVHTTPIRIAAPDTAHAQGNAGPVDPVLGHGIR